MSLLDTDNQYDLSEQKTIEREPLQINRVTISETGRLKIKFSKPILTIPIDPVNSGLRVLQKASKSINDILKVSIKGASDDDLDKTVASLDLIASIKNLLDLQVTFTKTKDISIDVRELDSLVVRILDPNYFIDLETGLPIDAKSFVDSIPVPPQITVAEALEAEKQAQQIASASLAFQIVELVLIFAFQKVLFSMWMLILTVQFLTFMSYWHINYPLIPLFVLSELRKITLGEFLDDIDFGDSIN